MKRSEVADKIGFVKTYISEISSKYLSGGINAIVGNNYKGNRRSLTLGQEVALLQLFKEKATAGQLVEISELKIAYEEATGKSLEKNPAQIYNVLKRHG